jgi:hypothetical protein
VKGVMDLRQFFKKIRDVEDGIVDQFPLVASLETGDGGKSGVVSEVPRCQAARMIVEGKARLASEEEKQVYIEQAAASRKHFDELEAAKRAHMVFIASPEPPPQQAPVRTPKK